MSEDDYRERLKERDRRTVALMARGNLSLRLGLFETAEDAERERQEILNWDFRKASWKVPSR